jgi:hypothetical protein
MVRRGNRRTGGKANPAAEEEPVNAQQVVIGKTEILDQHHGDEDHHQQQIFVHNGDDGTLEHEIETEEHVEVDVEGGEDVQIAVDDDVPPLLMPQKMPPDEIPTTTVQQYVAENVSFCKDRSNEENVLIFRVKHRILKLLMVMLMKLITSKETLVMLNQKIILLIQIMFVVVSVVKLCHMIHLWQNIYLQCIQKFLLMENQILKKFHMMYGLKIEWKRVIMDMMNMDIMKCNAIIIEQIDRFDVLVKFGLKLQQ